MKFMITWQFHPGKLADGLAHFSEMTSKEDEQDRGVSIKLIGRWHDLARGRGVATVNPTLPRPYRTGP